MDVELDPNTLDEIVDSLRGAWSATLRIPGNVQELALSFSSGSAAVALIAGEDEFYDLLASEPREGWAEFVHGGQPAEHPRRHCVSTADAMAYATEFLRRGSLRLPDARWERQGDHQTA